MKALELEVKNINRLSIIFEMGVYCIMNANPIVGGRLEEDMRILWEDGFLYKPLNMNPTIDEITKVQYWENTFIGIKVDTIDILKALFIQGKDYYQFFFKNSSEDIVFWKQEIRSLVEKYPNSTIPFEELFEIGKSLNNNSFQIWHKNEVLPYDESNYTYLITGDKIILELIEHNFKNCNISNIGEYDLFSSQDSIKWIDVN